jgi:hypothetical protein
MKAILALAACCFSLFLYSQNIQNKVADSLIHKKRTLPCKPGVKEEATIDTIRSGEFSNIVDGLYAKMRSQKVLTLEEDRNLVLLMNTLEWSDYFGQKEIRKKFPRLLSMEAFFDKKYKNELYRKYSVCNGTGFTPYFIELHTQYLGSPVACSRFYVIK